MTLSLGKTMVAVATTVVAASIVAGVVIVGSPARGRAERLDARRIQDLRAIMRATDQFWSHAERLPASLEELGENPRIRVTTVDPRSGESYEYRVLDADTYELCAVFDDESPARLRPLPESFWSHRAGRQCFELRVAASDRESGG